jgi:predicted HAD superfamily Cof-like phosphohydrolase
MTKTNFERVKEFQETFGLNMSDQPNLPAAGERDLRIRLLEEEFNEYLDGEQNSDLVEIADALGDILYIAYGTAASYGIPLDEVFAEIHASNMSKLDENGQPIYRDDGKVLKSEKYFKPRIQDILDRHGR